MSPRGVAEFAVIPSNGRHVTPGRPILDQLVPAAIRSVMRAPINRRRHRPTRLRRTGTISPSFLPLQFFDPTVFSRTDRSIDLCVSIEMGQTEPNGLPGSLI